MSRGTNERLPVSQALDLTGKRALITGASRGLGYAIAVRFAEAGAAVAAHYRSGKESAQALAEHIRDAGGDALTVQGDVASPADVKEMFAEAEHHFGGPIDILVNNAGTYPLHPLLTAPIEEWQDVIDSNLRGTHLCTQLAAQRMSGGNGKAAGGCIVNITSIEASRSAPSHSHYNAAKAAVVMYTKSAALELGPHNIRVNAVSPGLIWREGIEDAWPEGVSSYEKRAPLGALGMPEDIADACLFLASPSARWITGAELVVDGGMLASSYF